MGIINNLRHFFQRSSAKLFEAVELEDALQVRKLLESGTNPNANEGEALIRACVNGSKIIARLLLDAGANPNIDDSSALRRAIRARQTPIVYLLTEYRLTQSSLNYGLAHAVSAHNKEIVGILIRKGADLQPVLDNLTRFKAIDSEKKSQFIKWCSTTDHTRQKRAENHEKTAPGYAGAALIRFAELAGVIPPSSQHRLR